MEIAILLHLYQPITQSEEVFRRVYKESYDPLLKRIGRLKNFTVSLNIPLSLLEQMDRYDCGEWISDVKKLININKVELVGSAAYHPILPKLPDELVEKQIVLNEYGLGYYLGDHQNLEGDPAIMVKDLKGFFPPELALDERILSKLESLGYKWVMADETAVPFNLNYQQKHGIYKYKDYETKLVVRNRSFSNLISFKRDTDMSDIEDMLQFFKANDKSFVIVLDGECFGHHYSEGFFILESMVSLLKRMDIDIVSVSDYVENESCIDLKDFNASSWGASDEDMSTGNVYPMWADPSNDIHRKQWEILGLLTDLYSHDKLSTGVEEYSVLPFWHPDGIKRVRDTVLKRKIAREILMQKSLSSDQFWWASKKILPTGEYLYDSSMVKRGLQILQHLVGMYNNSNIEGAVETRISSIHDLLEKEDKKREELKITGN